MLVSLAPGLPLSSSCVAVIRPGNFTLIISKVSKGTKNGLNMLLLISFQTFFLSFMQQSITKPESILL